MENNKRIFPAGTKWKYNNTGVNILIRVIEYLYGKHFPKLIESLIFSPYGFKNSGWKMHNEDRLVWLNDHYVKQDGSESNLFVSARDLARWGYLHLNKGSIRGYRSIPEEVFEMSVTPISPVIEENFPSNGFFWFVQDIPRTYSEIGNTLPRGTYQALGITGCACLVVPKTKTVAIRMYNQVGSNPKSYNYLQDIKCFGDLVNKNVEKLGYDSACRG